MKESELDRIFAEDSQQEEDVSVEGLGRLSKLANLQLELQEYLKEKEALVKKIKDDLRQVQEIDIPNLMAELGVKSFTLDNGAKINVKEDVFASIRADRLYDALEYLEQQGLGGIVKDDVTVKFGKDQRELAQRVMEFCRDNGFNAQEKLHVHPQTLKATVKKELENGKMFPEELFSIQPFTKAVIK